jgi:hypothetical protein
MIDTTGGAGDKTDDSGDAFAAIWQACVHLRFPKGQLRQMADYLATSARRPGTATVDLDPHTVHRLLLAVATASRAAATPRQARRRRDVDAGS